MKERRVGSLGWDIVFDSVAAVSFLHPPLEGEGRLALSTARCETGWGDGLSTRAPPEWRDCHPTPPLLSVASTLPLQGRVRDNHGLFGSNRFSSPFQQSA